MTRAYNDKAWVPAINTGSDRVKLPSKKELGAWISPDADVEVLKMRGALQTGKHLEWLNQLGVSDEPLPNQDVVHSGTEDEAGRALIMQLLRAYQHMVTNTDDCSPSTALDVEHHIDVGDAAPIMLKRRRQAQLEGAVVGENVIKMLVMGVI
ncbi:hypothetical protein PI125_g23585 [Phytophthora idaei]|nr:hypothetical protein PI125_g23585 [Phytophthora idaei]